MVIKENYFCLCENHTQFMAFLRETGNKDVVYIDSPERLHGYQGGKVMYYGTWWARPDLKEIEKAMEEEGIERLR